MAVAGCQLSRQLSADQRQAPGVALVQHGPVYTGSDIEERAFIASEARFRKLRPPGIGFNSRGQGVIAPQGFRSSTGGRGLSLQLHLG